MRCPPSMAGLVAWVQWPWLACRWALYVNSTRPTFLVPSRVGLVEFMGHSIGTEANIVLESTQPAQLTRD